MRFAKGVFPALIGASVILNAEAKSLIKEEDLKDIREPLIESVMQQFLPFMRNLENKIDRMQNEEALLNASLESVKKKVSGIKSPLFYFFFDSLNNFFIFQQIIVLFMVYQVLQVLQVLQVQTENQVNKVQQVRLDKLVQQVRSVQQALPVHKV